MVAQMTHIHPLVFIRRNRILPLPGVINVRSGQKVNPSDVIVEAEVPIRHYLVDVYRTLKTKSPDNAEKLIQRGVGDKLEKHDIIAETGGMFSRVIRTPGPGRIISINDGRVLIEAECRKMVQKAGMIGTVTRIIEERGAVVETSGTLVQGVWGNNRSGSGTLMIQPESVEGELLTSAVGLNARGTILLAGYCSSADVFAAATTTEIGGMILGSMASSLVQAAEAQPYPIIVLGGFGRFGLDSISKRLLVSSAGRSAAINAVKWNRMTGERPEIIISLPSDGEPYPEQVEFSVGQIVRVHASEYLGRVGTVEKVMPGLTRLGSGLRASAAIVKFENGEKGIIPLVNLDVLQLTNEFLGTTDEGG